MVDHAHVETMRDVFDWQLQQTGQGELIYRGIYLGIECSMLLETFNGSTHYQFAAKRGGKWETYKIARELFDSFPKVHIEEVAND